MFGVFSLLKKRPTVNTAIVLKYNRIDGTQGKYRLNRISIFYTFNLPPIWTNQLAPSPPIDMNMIQDFAYFLTVLDIKQIGHTRTKCSQVAHGGARSTTTSNQSQFLDNIFQHFSRVRNIKYIFVLDEIRVVTVDIIPRYFALNHITAIGSFSGAQTYPCINQLHRPLCRWCEMVTAPYHGFSARATIQRNSHCSLPYWLSDTPLLAIQLLLLQIQLVWRNIVFICQWISRSIANLLPLLPLRASAHIIVLSFCVGTLKSVFEAALENAFGLWFLSATTLGLREFRQEEPVIDSVSCWDRKSHSDSIVPDIVNQEWLCSGLEISEWK